MSAKQRTIYMEQTRRGPRWEEQGKAVVKTTATLGEDGRWHIGDLSMDEDFMLRQDAILRIGVRLEAERRARIAIMDAELQLKRIDMLAAAGLADEE